ncbi:MAG: cation diffusion facilitator family transporter [Planctomycetaceae bacterium]
MTKPSRSPAQSNAGVMTELLDVPTEFPAPLQSPGHVEVARRSRLQEMQQVAVAGMGVRLLVIVVEVAALWWWGYAALLTDVTASMLDVVSSLAIVLAIRSAARPPDENHPFGHGRIEPLAGLLMGFVLLGAGVAFVVRNLFGLTHSAAIGTVSPWAWLIPGAAVIAMEFVSRRVGQIAEREQSTALRAEASHYRTDALTSLVAALGLAAAAVVPKWGHHLDLISAAVLSIIMIWLGFSAIRENLNQLLDHVPQDEHFELVRQAALRTTGVLGVEKLRIQHAGPDAHVDIDIEVDPDLTVAAAHVITQHVRAQIQSDWPMVREVVVHVEPYYAGDH